LLLGVLIALPFDGAARPAASPPPREQALLTGRFDLSDPAAPVFSHVSTSIKANFQGTGISGIFSSAGGTSYLYIIVDGIADPGVRRLIKIDRRRPRSFVLAQGLPAGDHQVEVVKENQYDTKVAFHGFKVTGGVLRPKPARPALSLEFYGDSNPAGHSAYDVFDRGAVVDNGGYFTYPGIAARLLNAEYHNISMGGVGITDKAWRNLVHFYDLIHMNDPATDRNLWNFGDYTPAAVIINVGSNDVLAGAAATDVKEGWKRFVTRDLRGHYPRAHIVLLESYGWSHAEPANCLADAVAELNAAGERNVSWVRIPWLWGQEHAVVNEHAGFANIVARHLAKVLHLPEPPLADLSSFAPYGGVTNGSFEKSTLPGVADGWRPRGAVTLVRNASVAEAGTNCLKLRSGAWAHFANDAHPGSQFTVTAWMRGGRDNVAGWLKIEFKDEDQKTIAANEDPVTLTTAWRKITTTATAPAGTWSVWTVLAAGKTGDVFFDDVSSAAEDARDQKYIRMPTRKYRGSQTP
jgi:hypothetical protein